MVTGCRTAWLPSDPKATSRCAARRYVSTDATTLARHPVSRLPQCCRAGHVMRMSERSGIDASVTAIEARFSSSSILVNNVDGQRPRGIRPLGQSRQLDMPAREVVPGPAAASDGNRPLSAVADSDVLTVASNWRSSLRQTDAIRAAWGRPNFFQVDRARFRR